MRPPLASFIKRIPKRGHSPEARGDAERVWGDEADVGRGPRAGGGRVHERRLDERAAFAVEAAAAWMSGSSSEDREEGDQSISRGGFVFDVGGNVPVCK